MPQTKARIEQIEDASAESDVVVWSAGGPSWTLGQLRSVSVDDAEPGFKVVQAGAGSTAQLGPDANHLAVSATGVITLVGTAERALTIRPEINIDEIKKQLVPDQVQIGVFFGYSLPIYVADHEELYMKQDVPGRWNGTSDIIVHLKVCLAAAEDVGDYFKFQLSWENVAEANDVVPITTHDVEVEQIVLAGRSAQYNVYTLTFTIDYDVDGEGNEIQAHDILAYRLRRIDATDPDITGEIIVLDWHDYFIVDKMFKAP